MHAALQGNVYFASVCACQVPHVGFEAQSPHSQRDWHHVSWVAAHTFDPVTGFYWQL